MTTEVIEPLAHGQDLPALWLFSLIVAELELRDLGANKGTDFILCCNEMVTLYPGHIESEMFIACFTSPVKTDWILKKGEHKYNSYEKEQQEGDAAEDTVVQKITEYTVHIVCLSTF